MLFDFVGKRLVFEKRIAELEKQLADCKVALKKRENSIEEYEQTLTYKARRVSLWSFLLLLSLIFCCNVDILRENIF